MSNNTSQRDLDLAILATSGHTIWWDETGQPAPRPDDFFDPDTQERGLRGPDLMARFEERLPELAYPGTWFGSVRAARTRAMIERLDAYLGQAPADARAEEGVRAELDIPDPDGKGPALPVLVTGRIDRLEHLDAPGAGASGERVRVIDLKTGQRAYSAPARHPQLATYRLALQARGYEVDGAALVLLGKEPPRKNQNLTDRKSVV